jgi:hypothetical protein
MGLLLICVFLSGCTLPSKDVDKPPSGTGFGLVVYWSGTFHKHRRFELRYWQKNEQTTVIWPNLTAKWLIKDNDDLALFFCWLNRGTSVDSKVGFEIFAAEGKGPPANLTDDLVHQFVTMVATNVAISVRDCVVTDVKELDGRFVFKVSDIGEHQGTIELTRDEVLKLIHEIRDQGQLLKDPVFETPYYARKVTTAGNQ